MVTANKVIKLSASFLVVVVLLSLHTHADGAVSLETQKQALDVIADFADRYCNKIPLTGEGNQVELTGEGKAELNELIKKIVDLKIEGAAKYLSGEYKGVLQKDLIKALEDNATCRKTIWDDLKNRLIPETQATISQPSPPPPVSWHRTNEGGQPYTQKFQVRSENRHGRPDHVASGTFTLSASNARIYKVEYLHTGEYTCGWSLNPDGGWETNASITQDGRSFIWHRNWDGDPCMDIYLAYYEVLR